MTEKKEKGQHGGPRANSGGAREGAGRPPNEPEYLDLEKTDDPKVFLTKLMNDENVEAKFRIDAAKSLMPYAHQKKGETGKKEAKQEEAEEVSGKTAFSPMRPPRTSTQ